MADAEWTFGTICQRFLAGLGARMHYGQLGLKILRLKGWRDPQSGSWVWFETSIGDTFAEHIYNYSQYNYRISRISININMVQRLNRQHAENNMFSPLSPRSHQAPSISILTSKASGFLRCLLGLESRIHVEGFPGTESLRGYFCRL